MNFNVYLDNAATTPISNDMKSYLVRMFDLYGNPSSIHSIGNDSRKHINQAREAVAKFIDAKNSEIYFTPGGSASNTLAIKGFFQKNVCEIFYIPTAHESIIKCVKSLPCHTHHLSVSCDGKIVINHLENSLRNCNHTPFVIIESANSEIGSIQNVKLISELVHKYKGILYVDYTGSISTLPMNIKYNKIDMAGFSGHKIGALKGIGVLYKKDDIHLEPIIYGNQENGLIGGTENVLGILSLGKAVQDINYSSINSKNRDYVMNYILSNISDSYVIGSTTDRLPHNLYVCFNNVEGESLAMILDINGVYVSTGSACSNISQDKHVLDAIHLPKNKQTCCIRMSFSGNESINELDYVNRTIKDSVLLLRNLKKEDTYK